MWLEELLEGISKENEQEYWVYGLGTSGRLFVDLCKRYNYPILGIIVGNGYRREETYNNVRIYEVREINKLDGEKAILFYTVKQEMGKTISQLEWEKEKIVDLSSGMYYEQMLKLYYMEYFIEKNIADQLKNSRKINFEGCICVNPIFFQQEIQDIYDVFLIEMGDLILPSVWNNYARIDEGSYENGMVRIEKEDVVIDCGANMGLFSAIAAWKGAKVFAFEPVQKTFEYLKMQTEIYPEYIYPIRMALSDRCGSGKIYEEKAFGENTLHGMNRGAYSEIVECITLDKFVEDNDIKRIDFIKADIEVQKEKCY